MMLDKAPTTEAEQTTSASLISVPQTSSITQMPLAVVTTGVTASTSGFLPPSLRLAFAFALSSITCLITVSTSSLFVLISSTFVVLSASTFALKRSASTFRALAASSTALLAASKST